ncbi:hypothetical protein [Paracoccus yeei]|uniref:hypothetical protein n=1 Tax=Paracoccus yeei TaxID=147645 RepID=UPI0011813EDC|nr:hypothetical protein [Paracoccus yeei]
MTAKQKSELDTDGITDQRRIDNLQNMLGALYRDRRKRGLTGVTVSHSCMAALVERAKAHVDSCSSGHSDPSCLRCHGGRDMSREGFA